MAEEPHTERDEDERDPEEEEVREPFAMPGRDILEPHESLKYIGKLFKGLAVAVALLILAEVIIGVSQDGVQALPILLLEVAQLVIMAGLLWGGGDIAYLIVETNHDVRASRVHLWQLNMMQKMEMQRGGMAVEPVDPERPLG